MKTPTRDSIWRIDLARDLAAPYIAHPDVRLVVLGGSPAKGISDQYSDLDIVVYWDTIDRNWIDQAPLTRTFGLQRKMNEFWEQSRSCFELYYAGTLIVEFGGTTVSDWRAMTQGVMERFEATPPVLKTIGGFLNAEVLHGQDLYRTLCAEVTPYPHELAVRIVRNSLGFFWNGVLENQGLNRGEFLFVQDAICATIKRLLTILAALNHTYYSPMEPRWIEYEYGKMPIVPSNLWPKILDIVNGDRRVAIGRLDALIQEVLDLVRSHMPEIDLDDAKRRWDIDVRGCLDRPI